MKKRRMKAAVEPKAGRPGSSATSTLEAFRIAYYVVSRRFWTCKRVGRNTKTQGRDPGCNLVVTCFCFCFYYCADVRFKGLMLRWDAGF